jgi:short-subunit dehydrogenase
MARHFKPVGTHAIHVLARLAAKRAVQDELRAQGVRVTLVRPAEIAERAVRYLEQRAKLLGLIKPQPIMITPDLAERNS